MRKIQQGGSVLLSIIIMLPFLILILASFMQLAGSNLQLSRRDSFRTHAQFAADAGADIGLKRVNDDPLWTGSLGEIELVNNGKLRTTYELTVTDVDADTKVITTIGKTYSPVTATTENASVSIDIELRAVTSGLFSVVTGVGGLYLSNSAKIVGGDVFVNGEIELSNTAQIGLSTSPVNLDVAHQNCPNPADATYPRICLPGENGEPISISNSAQIFGSVSANNQTSTAGLSSPGLVSSSGVTPQPLPPHDRDAQKAAATNNMTASAASCSSGTRTWPANTKITGNVTITNSCVVTVYGDVWITGTLTVRNSGQLVVADSLGVNRPNLMIDGSSAIFRNTALLKSNVSNTGFQVVTYRSSPSCSPDCGDLTGQDLYNSRNLTTIELQNSASGPNTIFYARWSRVTVDNSGAIGALVGQTIELRNSGTITFGTSTGTGTTRWIINRYKRVY